MEDILNFGFTKLFRITCDVIGECYSFLSVDQVEDAMSMILYQIGDQPTEDGFSDIEISDWTLTMAKANYTAEVVVRADFIFKAKLQIEIYANSKRDAVDLLKTEKYWLYHRLEFANRIVSNITVEEVV